MVHVLLGEEDLLKESALSRIKKKYFLTEDTSALAFNYISIDGRSTTSAQIIDECQQLPFIPPLRAGAGLMSDTRLVVVEDAEKIIDDKLLEYIKNPVKTTCLVLLIRKIDKRLNMYKTLDKHAEIQEFDHPNEKEITGWIQHYIQAKKKRLSTRDASYIANALENNLTGIVQELEKLVTYVGQRENITEMDIKTVISENKLKDIFSLTGAIQNKDTSVAIKLINELLDQGNSVQQIIGTIRWMLTRLWQIKDGDTKDIPPYFLNKLIDQAKKFSIEQLKGGLVTLLALEKLMRTYTLPQRLLLELLVIQLTEKTSVLINA